jgi:GTP-binding protein HflX
MRQELKLPEDVVAISAARGLGFDELLAAIERLLEVEQAFVPVTLSVPYSRSDMVDRFHKLGRVEGSNFDERGTTLTGLLPSAMVSSFAPYIALISAAQEREGEPALLVPHTAA